MVDSQEDDDGGVVGHALHAQQVQDDGHPKCSIFNKRTGDHHDETTEEDDSRAEKINNCHGNSKGKSDC